MLDDIVSSYLSGATQAQLRERFNIGEKPLRRTLLAAGVTLRKRGGGAYNRKHKFDLGYFSKTDSAETSYWSGFIYADGTLLKYEHTDALILVIGKQDAAHVRKFAASIGYGGPVEEVDGFNGGKGSVRVRLYGPLAAGLMRFGVVPRKSKVWKTPALSDVELPHFLRGWFDGDGTIRDRRHKEEFRITGNQAGVLFYRDALHRLGYDGSSRFEQTNGSWKLCIPGRLQVLKVRSLINGDVRLERKWSKLDGLTNIPQLTRIRMPGHPVVHSSSSN